MARDLNARITVKLNPLVPAQNIFNYKKLISSPQPAEEPKRTRKVFNEYDLEDAFIDDQIENEMDENYSWEFGFFAWKGSLEELFDDADGAKLDPAEPVADIDFVNLRGPKKDRKLEIDGDMEVKEDGEGGEKPEVVREKPKKSKKQKATELTAKSKSEDGGLTAGLTSTPSKSSKISTSKITETIDLTISSGDSLPEQVLKQLQILQAEAKKADFTMKKQFPPQLKPLFVNVINSALDHGIYEKIFYERIISILPYNSFTMQKLAMKIVYPDRINSLKQELDKLYNGIKNCLVGDSSGNEKIKWNEDLRIHVWNILNTEWEIALLDNISKELLKEQPQFTEAGVRKATYQKLNTMYNQLELKDLSKEYSKYKKKREHCKQPDKWNQSIIRMSMFSKVIRKKTDDAENTKTQTPESEIQAVKRKTSQEHAVDKKIKQE